MNISTKTTNNFWTFQIIEAWIIESSRIMSSANTLPSSLRSDLTTSLGCRLRSNVTIERETRHGFPLCLKPLLLCRKRKCPKYPSPEVHTKSPTADMCLSYLPRTQMRQDSLKQFISSHSSTVKSFFFVLFPILTQIRCSHETNSRRIM